MKNSKSLFGGHLPLIFFVLVLVCATVLGARSVRPCHHAADIMILVDSSGSVRLSTFSYQMKHFLQSLFKQIKKVIRHPRTSLATFDSRINHILRFTYDNDRVESTIKGMTYMGGATALGRALVEASKYVKYYGRKGVDTVLIVLSDCHPTAGRRVRRKVIKTVKSVFDIVIPIGITKSINQYCLQLMAKHSRMTLLTHIGLKKAVARVIHDICRPIIKKCPKHVIFPPRCLRKHWLYRTISYHRQHYLCLRRVHSHLRKVRCKLPQKTRIVCRYCQRFLLSRYWRVRNCRCMPRIKRKLIGRCCCPKTRRRRSCLNTQERVDYTSYDFVNGQCWPRKVKCHKRCSCPKIQNKRFCLGNHILERTVKHQLTRDRQCLQSVTFSKSPIQCRFVSARTGYCFKKLTSKGYTVVRKVRIVTYYKTKGCHCRSKIQTYLEPCKCKAGPRSKWTRLCKKDCKRVCNLGCYHEKTWFVYKLVKAYGGHYKCQAVPVVRRQYRCCCRINRTHRQFCKENRLVNAVSYTNLLSGKCVRFTKIQARKRTCCEGIISRTKAHHHGRLGAIIEVYQFRRGCDCLRKKRTLYIRSRCPRGSYRKVCRRGVLTFHRWFSYSLGRGCVTRHQRRSARMYCPRHRKIVAASCYRGIKYVLFEKIFRVKCQCIVRLVKARRGHCRCPRNWTSQWRCYRHRFYIRRAVTFKRDRIGQCQRRKAMRVKRLLGCRRHSWRTYRCDRRTGVLRVYYNLRRLQHCRCKRSRKLIHFARCHCKLINRKYGYKRRRYCDTRRNHFVTEQTYFVHDKKRKTCVRKTRVIRHAARCPHKVKTRISRCDLVKRRRCITRTRYRAAFCRCILQRRVTYERCGCASRKVLVVCNRKLGLLVRTIHLKVWNRKLDRCDRTKRFVRIPIRCRRAVRIRRTPCNGKFYVETRIWFTRRKRSCSCQKRVKRRKINCYCPPRTTISRCHRSYMLKMTQFFIWNPISKRCKPSTSVRCRLRCRCPQPRTFAQCYHGWHFIKKIRYALSKYTCVQSVSITRQAIFCTKDVRITWTKCKRCHRIRTIHSRFPHPKTCRCNFRPTHRTRCRCCPCPRSRTFRKCLGGHWIYKSIRFKAVRRGGCVRYCARSVRVRFVRVNCPRRPASFWTRCVKCRRRRIVHRRVWNNCRCSYRRVRTGMTRRCCCPKPFRARKCRKGYMVMIKAHYVLKRSCCLMIKSVVKYKKMCPLIRIPVIVKKCNTRTCRQLILSAKMVPVPGTCKCKIVRVRRSRKCCCRRKGYRYTVCLGTCWLERTVTYKFNPSTKLCVRKTSTIRGCLRCRPPVTTRGRCNRNSCYRFVTHKRFGFSRSAYFGRCHCRPRVTRHIERCCCPPPSPWIRSCDGKCFVWRRTRFVLRGSKCRRVPEHRRRKVRCRRGRIARRVSKCKRPACTRCVTVIFERRIGCRCLRFQRRRFSQCCCPSPRTRRVCLRNNLVTVVTKYYRLVKQSCLPKMRTRNIRKISGCRPIKKLFSCNPKTKRRKGFIQTYRVKNCVCVPARGRRISVPCGCPAPTVRSKPCSRPSCLRKRITTFFRLRGKRCIRFRKARSVRCCCQPPLVRRRVRCNPRSGQKEKILLSKVFLRGAKSCVTLKSVTSLGIGRNCLTGAVRIRRGGCNRRTRLAIDTLIYYRHVRNICRCVHRIKKRKRVCDCPRCRRRRFCRHGVHVVRTTCFRLYAGICHTVTRSRRSIARCPRNYRVLRRCKGCRGTLIVLQNVRVGCRCLRRRKTRAIVCCCPPPKRQVICVNPFLQTVVTGFVLNRRRTKCLRVVVRRSLRVRSCRRSRRVVLKCDRQSCKRTIYKLVFGIKKCRCCLLRRIRRLITCCCPRSKSRRTCNRATGVITTLHVRYSLQHGVCVRQERIVQKETRCDAVSVQVGPCQRGSRSILIRGERRVQCSCRPTLRGIHQKCDCPASRIVKQACHRNMKWRRVFLVYFRQLNVRGVEICKRFLKKLYSERCKCPPSVVRRSCEHGSKVIDRITYRLVRRYGQHICLATRRRTRAVVTCRAPKIVRLGCHGCRQKVRRLLWRVVKCSCRSFLTYKIEACNCHTKNTFKTKCVDSVVVKTLTSYKAVPGYKRCVATTRSTIKHVVCPRKCTLPLTTSCTIFRKHASYREYETVWYTKQGCSCRKHSKRFIGLCHCRKPFQERKCTGSAIKVTRHYFVRKGVRCVRMVKVNLSPVKCPGRRVRVRRGPCSSTCMRTITVICSSVRACKCRLTSRSVRQRCCAPRPRMRRLCDVRRGYRVTQRRRFFLRVGGVLLRKAGVVIPRKVAGSESVVTKELVVCPAPTRRVVCNRATGIQTTTLIRWLRRGCNCKSQVRKSRRNCRCRPPRRRAGRCHKGLRTVRVVFYTMRNSRCRGKVVLKRERCSCPRDRVRRLCDRRRGHHVTCRVRNHFNRARKCCTRTVTCRSRMVPCGPKRVIRGGCNRRTGLRIIRIWVHRLRKDRCVCEKKLFKRAEICSCSHLNRKHKSCVRNCFIAFVTFRFILNNGHCALQLRRTLRETVCAKKKVRLSKCMTRGRRRGFRVKTTIRFVPKNCGCVQRRSHSFVRCSCKFLRRCRLTVRRTCAHNVRIIRRSFCVLRLGICQKRIQEFLRQLRCRRKIHVRSKPCRRRGDGSSYKLVTFFRLKLRNCKCVWVLLRTVKRVCKCPVPRTSHRCLHNRIRLMTTVRFSRHFSGTHCRGSVRSRAVAIRCPRDQKHSSCNRKTCRRRVVIVRHIAVKCHCRRRRAVVWRTCCCPRPSPKLRSCAPDGRTVVLRWTRFSFALGRCFPVPCFETRRVRCERRPPKLRIGPCRRLHRRKCITSFHTRRCKCIEKKRVSYIRCGCSRKVSVLRGKCKGSFATDRVVTFRLRKKRCVRAELRRRRRCRCPPPRHRTFCSSHNVLTTRFVTFRLRGASCMRRVVKRSRLLDGCDRRPAVLRRERGLCRGKKRVVRVVFIVARRCHCRRFVRRKTEGCNCYRPAREIPFCKRNNLLVTVTLHFLRRKGRCVVVRRRQRSVIDCFGSRIDSDSCKGRRYRTIRLWRRVARRCKCSWRLHRTQKALCRCPRPRKVRACVRHRFRRVTRISFALRRGRCFRRVTTELREVCCRVGRFRLRSACSARGFRLITHVTRRLRNCRCFVRRLRRRCRCRCPKPRRAAYCLKGPGVRKTVIVTFRLRKCGCERMRRVRSVRVRCGRTLRHAGRCRKAPDGNFYREERITIRKRNGCECRRTFRRRRVLCSCASRPLHVIRCKGDNKLVLIKTRVVRKGNRCARVRYRIKIRRVVCGRSKTAVVCRGKVKIIKIWHRFVRKCKCRVAVKVIKGHCKCPFKRRLVRRGSCVHCYRDLTFARQRLVGLKCVTRLLHRKQRCCCPKKVRRSRSCNRATGVLTFVTRVLRFVKGRCVWQTGVVRKRTRCSRHKRRHVRRRRDGFEVITVVFYRRVGCSCRLQQRKFVRRWACPHGRFKFSCTASNMWKRLSIKFKLVKNRCVKLCHSKLIPVMCAFNRERFTKCRPVRFGLANRVIRLVYRKKKCRCKRYKFVRTVLCRCFAPRVRKRCLKKSNTRIYILEKFLPLANRRACRRVVLVNRRKIKCQNTWRLVSKSACVKVFAKSVAEGCHCRLKLRKLRRRVRCRKPLTVLGGCHRKSCLRHVRIIRYVKHRCHCVRHDRVRMVQCCKAKCPPPKTYKRKCLNGRVKVESLSFRWIHGKCRPFRKKSFKKFVPKCHYKKYFPAGPCQHGLKLFKLVIKVPSKCHCVERHLMVQKRCGHHKVNEGPRK